MISKYIYRKLYSYLRNIHIITIFLKKFIKANIDTSRYCPICGTFLLTKFRKYNIPPVPPIQLPPLEDWLCPYCGSHPRFRFMYIYLTSQYQENSNIAVLHFAPEECLIPLMKKLFGLGWKSADILPGRAMIQADITDIKVADNEFDLVICSHVLEHVQDDYRALHELYRILKTGGQALLVVPMNGKITTIEDPNCSDPIERLRRFGQDDHFRLYGYDFIDRVKSAGFDVTRIVSNEFIRSAQIHKLLLGDHMEYIYIATKKKRK